MEGAGEDDQSGTINTGVTRLAGEEDGVGQANFDAERARRLAALPPGSTKSGAGKLNQVTVKPGDTLWKLAERKDIYGSGWLYPLIYKANKDLIKDPNRLEAGLKLVIPRDLSRVQEEMAKEEAMTGQILDTSPLNGAKPTAVAPTAGTSTKARSAKAGGHGWLWALLLLLAGALFFLWQRMKKQQEEADNQPAA